MYTYSCRNGKVFQLGALRLKFETCMQKHVRVFPVPPGGSAYSSQTCCLDEYESSSPS